MCTALMHGDKRAKGAAVSRDTLHADFDGGHGGHDRARLLGAAIVGSGTRGNWHAHIRLAHPVPAHHHAALQRALVTYLDADRAKINDNDLLRPPGTLNHKPTVFTPGADPALVEWLVEPDGTLVDPFGLARQLGIALPEQPAPANSTMSSSTVESVEITKHPKVSDAFNVVTGDRSSDTARVVGACYDSNLTLPQTRHVVNSRADLAIRLAERKDDDIATLWHKIDDDRRTRRQDDDAFFAPHVAAQQGHSVSPAAVDAAPPVTKAKPALRLVKASSVGITLPDWAWECSGSGRIPCAALTLFAGRPAAGKSTAARWFTAGWSRGTLPGQWEGQPVNVAYLATEEHWQSVVTPSLTAASADMDRVYFMQRGDDPATVKAVPDEAALTAAFDDKGIRVVVCDPLMSTLTSGADLYKSNEIRDALEPWVRIAEKIDGVVLGVTHLVKSAASGDVVAAINGSSAFGEVARAVFGFAVDHQGDDGTRIMSQGKNSAGRDGLNLTYRIEAAPITADDGRGGEVARFVMGDPTEVSVSDLLLAEGKQKRPMSAGQWLEAWFDTHADVTWLPVTEVISAGQRFGHTEDALARARDRRGYLTHKNELAWFWARPDAEPFAGTDEAARRDDRGRFTS